MVWAEIIRLKDFWRDESKSIIEKRDEAVKRIKASDWRKITSDPGEFDSLVDEFAEVLNVEEFDYALSELYDLADSDRVWLETR